MFKISNEERKVILDYMSKRPYAEVYTMVAMIQVVWTPVAVSLNHWVQLNHTMRRTHPTSAQLALTH